DWPVVEGGAFTDADVKAAAQVCLVGQTVVDNLFGDETPVGKRVRVKGLPFKVVGVLDRKGANTFGADQDDVLLLPWTTVKKKLQGSVFMNVDQIYATAATPGALVPLQEEVTEILRQSHRLTRPGGATAMDDFTIRNM